MSANWPPRPDFDPPDEATKVKLFGKFQFKPAPVEGNPEAIVILGTWVRDNIVSVHIPQLKDVMYAPKSCTVSFHKAGASQLVALFKAWEDEGNIQLVRTWLGSFVPRFVRGSRTSLSNHSIGTAIDLNASWNGLGVEPALVGAYGSVRKLVPTANRLGFAWGGHYRNGRPDGMHFEIAKLVQV